MSKKKSLYKRVKKGIEQMIVIVAVLTTLVKEIIELIKIVIDAFAQ